MPASFLFDFRCFLLVPWLFVAAFWCWLFLVAFLCLPFRFSLLVFPSLCSLSLSVPFGSRPFLLVVPSFCAPFLVVLPSGRLLLRACLLVFGLFRACLVCLPSLMPRLFGLPFGSCLLVLPSFCVAFGLWPVLLLLLLLPFWFSASPLLLPPIALSCCGRFLLSFSFFLPSFSIVYFFSIVTKYGNSLNVWNDGGDVCVHSNVVTCGASVTVSNNSLCSQ